jgi:hypothetical protein
LGRSISGLEFGGSTTSLVLSSCLLPAAIKLALRMIANHFCCWLAQVSQPRTRSPCGLKLADWSKRK